MKKYSEECQENPENSTGKQQYDEVLRLKKENEELRKENSFLKKRRHSLQRKFKGKL